MYLFYIIEAKPSNLFLRNLDLSPSMRFSSSKSRFWTFSPFFFTEMNQEKVQIKVIVYMYAELSLRGDTGSTTTSYNGHCKSNYLWTSAKNAVKSSISWSWCFQPSDLKAGLTLNDENDISPFSNNTSRRKNIAFSNSTVENDNFNCNWYHSNWTRIYV